MIVDDCCCWVQLFSLGVGHVHLRYMAGGDDDDNIYDYNMMSIIYYIIHTVKLVHTMLKRIMYTYTYLAKFSINKNHYFV